eukprot:COSAG02_NODE_83711_length_101_cov_95.000000_1_plen_22_part_01
MSCCEKVLRVCRIMATQQILPR